MAAFSNLETVWQDARHGSRMLRSNPGFAAAAILTLALGIGANTAIFSVVNSVLLKPLPFKDAKRLAIIWETSLKDRATISPVCAADFVDWKDQTRAFEQVAAWRFLYFNLSGRDQLERVQGLAVSASFLPLLGARIQAGHTFLPEEEQVGHDKVAILSDALWRRRFAADPGLVGQKINIEGEPYTVVGILASTFHIFRVLNRPLDIYVLLTFEHTRLNRQDHDTFVYARLKPGVTVKQAQSELVSSMMLFRTRRLQRYQTNARSHEVKSAQLARRLGAITRVAVPCEPLVAGLLVDEDLFGGGAPVMATTSKRAAIMNALLNDAHVRPGMRKQVYDL